MTALESPVALNRLNRIPARLNEDAGRPSAVLVGLMPDAGRWHVIMTERAHHLAHHAGQISFPGGRKDDTDKDLQETALRETFHDILKVPLLYNSQRQLQPAPGNLAL